MFFRQLARKVDRLLLLEVQEARHETLVLNAVVRWLRHERRRVSKALIGFYTQPYPMPRFENVPANLQPLIDEATATVGVLASAAVFIKGVPGLIAAAKAEVLANGATAEQLKPLADLIDAIKAGADDVTAAIAAVPS